MYREYFRFGFRMTVFSSFSAPDLLGFLQHHEMAAAKVTKKLEIKFQFFSCCCKRFKYIFILKTAEIGNILTMWKG